MNIKILQVNSLLCSNRFEFCRFINGLLPFHRDLTSNAIEFLPKGVFAKLEKLNYL